MLIFMVPCIMNQIDLNFLGYRATWMDYMMGCFEGVNRVDPKTFQFPTMWLLIMGAGLFMNLDYLLGDLSLSGQQIIVRSGNRRGWYFSKCIWNLCSTALYLLLGSLGVLVFTILMGGVPSVANSPTVTLALFGVMMKFPGPQTNPIGTEENSKQPQDSWFLTLMRTVTFLLSEAAVLTVRI
jgi:hypothetical protein